MGYSVAAMGAAVIALGAKILSEHGQMMQAGVLAATGVMLIIAGLMAASSSSTSAKTPGTPATPATPAPAAPVPAGGDALNVSDLKDFSDSPDLSLKLEGSPDLGINDLKLSGSPEPLGINDLKLSPPDPPLTIKT